MDRLFRNYSDKTMSLGDKSATNPQHLQNSSKWYHEWYNSVKQSFSRTLINGRKLNKVFFQNFIYLHSPYHSLFFLSLFFLQTLMDLQGDSTHYKDLLHLSLSTPVAQQDKPIGESKEKPWFWSCSSNMLNICPFCKSEYNASIKYQTKLQKWFFWTAQTNRTVWDHPSVTQLQKTQSEYVCVSQRKEKNPSAESHDLSTQSTVSNAL